MGRSGSVHKSKFGNGGTKMAEPLSYLIIGNGIASVTATEILRSENEAAEVTVIADDLFPVFYRPALKDYLAGRVLENKLWARPNSFYQDSRIRFICDRVVGIQGAQHTVQLQSGRRIGYHRMLLSNGASAVRLNCPGMNLKGVYTLRTIADYQALQNRLNTARRVVVSGSGTLALETIETLRHRGFKVTHLLRRRTLWSEVLDATASDLVLQQERRDGVDIHREEEIAEITGSQGQVSGVMTNRGTLIPCEIVILALGIKPNIDFVRQSGIACGRGVKVNAGMSTNVPDIFAAGDILETTDAITGRTRVIGQWYPAIQQARAAAFSMLDLLDKSHPFHSSTFYNATFLYGLDFASVGLTQLPRDARGYQEIVADPQPRTYRKVILKDGVIVGAISLGDRKGTLILKRAIDHGVNLMPISSRLFASDFKLKAWLDKQGVPPPILSANREGSAAVKQIAYAEGTRRGTSSLQLQPLMEAWLVPADKQSGSQAVRVPETRLSETRTMTIGREAGVFLRIEDSMISRRHAEISYVNTQYVLRDLGSVNGTFVNNTPLTPGSVHILQQGDSIRFGKNVSALLQLRPVTMQEKQMHGQTGTGMASPTNMARADASSGSAASQDDEMLTSLSGPVADGQPVQAAQSVGRPIFNADGSLTLPGASSPVPPNVVAALKKTPALILVLHGNPEVFPMKQGKRITLGRDKANDIVLTEMMASRKHAEVYQGPANGRNELGPYYIHDLGSSNGVKVNQVRIDNPYQLTDGDCITVANVMIYFIQQIQQRTGGAQPPDAQPSAVAAPTGEMKCRNCGTSMNRSARFCPKCGTSARVSMGAPV
jgi:NADPH-dependent 2,4-dienoyl-CoA reductase/sulfur reductase-like enzyme/pSer/pThr/pTyr-binding forkhead associated (FHA) protein